MKKSRLGILGVVFAASLLLPALSAAAEKIGFVDIREVMLNSETGKKAAEEFKKIFDKNRSAIQEREAELKTMKDEIDKQRSVVTEAALKEKESAYQKKVRDYQLMVKDANEDLQSRDQELSKTIIPEILKVVSDIGDKEKFTMILDVSTMPVAYWSKDGDLTKRVIEEFNKTYKPKK